MGLFGSSHSSRAGAPETSKLLLELTEQVTSLRLNQLRITAVLAILGRFPLCKERAEHLLYHMDHNHRLNRIAIKGSNDEVSFPFPVGTGFAGIRF